MVTETSIPEEQPSMPAPILVASKRSWPTVAVLRAAALARLSGARLVVLRVLPPARPKDATLAAWQPFNVLQQTRWWCTRVLPPAMRGSVAVHQGDFQTEVVRVVGEVRPAIIVLQGGERLGSLVTGIARATHVPVLVARTVRTHDTIVAATDLADERYPVLAQSSELGLRLEAPLIFVHNITPEVAFPDHVPVPEPIDQALVDERRGELRQIARRIGTSAETVVMQRPSSAEAVLEIARASDADLIVVGSRPRSRLRRSIFGSVAARVVDRARRSVLVLPLPAAGA